MKLCVSYNAYEKSPEMIPLYRFVDFEMSAYSKPYQIIAKAKSLIKPYTPAALWVCNGRSLIQNGEILV